METYLQGIIGTEKQNLKISVIRDKEKKEIQVYHGFSLVGTVPDQKDHLLIKVLPL